MNFQAIESGVSQGIPLVQKLQQFWIRLAITKYQRSLGQLVVDDGGTAKVSIENPVSRRLEWYTFTSRRHRENPGVCCERQVQTRAKVLPVELPIE